MFLGAVALAAVEIVFMLLMLGCTQGNVRMSQKEIDELFSQAGNLNANSKLPYDYLVSYEEYSHNKFISSGGTETAWKSCDWTDI